MTAVIVASVRPGELPGLCARVSQAVLGSPDRSVECDVSGVEPADLAAVDGLARVALAARRAGGHVRLVGPSRELCELIAFAGLADALGVTAATGVALAARRAGRTGRCRGRT